MEKTKVKTLVRQIRGVSYKPEDLHNELDDNSVVLLRANNIDEGKINFDDVVYVDKSKVSDEQYLKYGDILICASSGSKNLVGKAASIRFNTECTFGAFCKVIRPKEGLDEYLSVYFQSPIYRRKISEVAIGVNINNIRNEHIDELDIPVFSNDEQASIVKKIHLIQEVISNRKAELEKLDDLIKARFVEMFGDPNDTKRLSDSRHKIGELCDVTKLAGFEFTEYINYQDSGEIIMLRGLNCKQGKLVLDNVKYIDRETSNKLPRSRLYVGDILMTYAGTIGDVAMVDEDDKYHLAPNVAKISIVAKDMLNPTFLVHLFMYSHDYIMTFASQVAQASINMQKIRDFEYIIPSMEEQIEFEQFANQVNKSKVAVQKTLEQTQTLFDSLMQKYFG